MLRLRSVTATEWVAEFPSNYFLYFDIRMLEIRVQARMSAASCHFFLCCQVACLAPRSLGVPAALSEPFVRIGLVQAHCHQCSEGYLLRRSGGT